MKKKSEFYTSDGRINPDKAFGLVLDVMKSMTPEEFVQFRDTPVKFRSVDPKAPTVLTKTTKAPRRNASAGAAPSKASQPRTGIESVAEVKNVSRASAALASKLGGTTKSRQKKTGS